MAFSNREHSTSHASFIGRGPCSSRARIVWAGKDPARRYASAAARAQAFLEASPC
jgi:hypothetical protein